MKVETSWPWRRTTLEIQNLFFSASVRENYDNGLTDELFVESEVESSSSDFEDFHSRVEEYFVESEGSDGTDCYTKNVQAGVNENCVHKFGKLRNLLFKTTESVNNPNDLSYKVPSGKCSMKCNKKCPDVVKSMTSDELNTFKVGFKGQTIVETKNILLRHLRKQSDIGAGLKGYVLKGYTFCVKYFAFITKISEYILRTVLEDSVQDVVRYVHGNDSNPRESLAAVKFTCWMKTFSELYGQSAPDHATTVLPAWLTKATLFKLYREECTPPLVKKSTFYKLFKDKFGYLRCDKSLPHVRISKYSTHSVCPQCVALANYQRTCKTEQEVEYCKNLKFQHKQCYGLARRRICELQQLAITYPEEHLFMSLDGMDNRKSDVPKFQQNSKNFGNFQKLPSHITGAIVTSGFYPEKMKNYFFVNHNQFENGSNMVITIIYHLLHAFLQDHHKFPKILHIQTDNCGRENKNRYVFTFLSALVELGVFSTITMDFLLVGHTGNEVDSNFSVLAKLFKESEIRSVDELSDIVRNAPFVPKAICKNLFYIFDWKLFIMNKFAKTPLEHHSFYHSFEIASEGGQAKFRAKLYPQDTEYGPETGIQLIKSGTEFEAVGPAAFRVEKLELDKVFKSLQNYFSTMPFSERVRVSSSWEALRKTLESLPGRKDNLLKMKITEFPKQSVDPVPVIPEHFGQFVGDDENVPQLRGEVFPAKISDGNFNLEIAEDADVVVYTKSKVNRPWVGRVINILPGNKFTLQWYQRRGRGNTFHAMVKQDGSPVLCEQDTAVVMYWHISDQASRTETSFKLSTFWLEKIHLDYLNHDAAYE